MPLDDYRDWWERSVLAWIKDGFRRLPFLPTDIIVGFPGETTVQFQRTYSLLEELRAGCRTPGTLLPPAWNTCRPPDVLMMCQPPEEIVRRFRLLDSDRSTSSEDRVALSEAKQVEVLLKERSKGRLEGAKHPPISWSFVSKKR